MYREKVEKLQDLRANFDIFTPPSPPAPELIRAGLIPPLPVFEEYLVWGFPHLAAAHRLGIREVNCSRIEGSPRDALETALLMENRTDRYSWSEKKNLLRLLYEFPEIDPDERLLSLVQTEGSFLPLTEMFLQLPDFLQIAVDTGMIDLKTGKKAAGLTEETFDILAVYLRELSFSSGRQFLRMFTECIRRDEMDRTGMERFAEELIDSPDPLRTLRERRYPQLTEMERTVRDFRDRYLRGTGIELIPPPNFEGASYALRFSWKSGRQLLQVIKTLQNLEEHGHDLFKLLY